MTARIAFYAPMKPPGHKTPSGDRQFARLLLRALHRAGYQADVASSLRSRNRDGDPDRQRKIEARADKARTRLMQHYAGQPPNLWFTYHNYYKAPDLLGPPIADALDIPYVLVEASHAPDRADGAWARGSAVSDAALRRADLILQPNPKDRPGVALLLGDHARQVDLPPFLAIGAASADRDTLRADWARRLSLDPGIPWLIATGMMRPDSKRDSFLMLAAMMQRLAGRQIALILVGDGAARGEIEAGFAGDTRIRWAGLLPQHDLRDLNTAGDLFVWPALKEAFGMAPLEAQAAGLPAVIGDRPGIRAMLRDGETAVLTPEGDLFAFSAAVADLLDQPQRRQAMSVAAAAHIRAHHDLSSAARLLQEHLDPLLTRGRMQ